MSSLKAFPVLANAREPLAVALVGTDYLDHETYEVLLRTVQPASSLQLIITAFDALPVARAATALGIAFSRVDDQDLALTSDETAMLLRSAGLSPAPDAVAAVHRVSRGHLGLICSAINRYPLECELGTLHDDQVLNAFLTVIKPESWPSSIARFASILVEAPRFSARVAVRVSGDENASSHMHRLLLLGLGTLTHHVGINERIFSWHESIRFEIAQFIRQAVPADPTLAPRVAKAAAAIGDRELQVAMLAGSGDLRQAEEVLTDHLWDVFPDGPSPLWHQVEELSAADLLSYPSLLCLRQQLAHQGISPLTPAALSRVALTLTSEAPRDPWRRLATQARAFELARQGLAFRLAGDIGIAARDLVTELLDSSDVPEIPFGAVSNLLMLAQGGLKLGSPTFAAQVAHLALRLIVTDPGHLDPQHIRRSFAGRVTLYSHRERGLADPIDATGALSGHQYYTRDADHVLANVALMWNEIDRGDPTSADRLWRLAFETVESPHDWPVLLFTRSILLGILGDAEELNQLSDMYSAARPQSQDPSLESPSKIHRLLGELVTTLTGRRFDSPEYLTVFSDDDDLRDAAPRVYHNIMLNDALTALRSGHEESARSCLQRAATATSQRRLAPLILARASEDELTQLEALLTDHPAVLEALNLERARGYSRMPDGLVECPSPRESEVLEHLRAGLTNKAIAEAMFVSVNTVKFHRANLMRKLGANSLSEVLSTAARLGL